MKITKPGEICSAILALGGVSALIWNGIDIWSFRIFAYAHLAILTLSFSLDEKFAQKYNRLEPTGVKSIKQLIFVKRGFSIVGIIVLFVIPKVYEEIPSWVNREAANLMTEVKKEGTSYDLEVCYNEKYPKTKNLLFFYLRDSAANLPLAFKTEYCTGADVHPVMLKLIGTPQWVNNLMWVFLGVSIVLFFLVSPLSNVGTKKTPVIPS